MPLLLRRFYTPALRSRLTARQYATSSEQIEIDPQNTVKGRHRSIARKLAAHSKLTVETEEAPEPTSDEESIKHIERIRLMSRFNPTLDLWGHHMTALDVMLPRPVTFATRSRFPSARSMLDQFLKNRLNDGKNALSLLGLASENGIPGVDSSGATFFQKFVTSWPWKIFSTKSTKAGSWMEPLRKEVFSTYQDLNVAIAKRDEKQIKRLTTSGYQLDVLRMLKKNRNLKGTCIWRFHREVTPTQVLSIRAMESNLSLDPPKFGNRMAAQVLVKFDTEQSLEMYDQRGKAVHEPANGKLPLGLGIVPAKKRRVTEYLVLEKRMWYDNPWSIREQIYDNN